MGLPPNSWQAMESSKSSSYLSKSRSVSRIIGGSRLKFKSERDWTLSWASYCAPPLFCSRAPCNSLKLSTMVFIDSLNPVAIDSTALTTSTCEGACPGVVPAAGGLLPGVANRRWGPDGGLAAVQLAPCWPVLAAGLAVLDHSDSSHMFFASLLLCCGVLPDSLPSACTCCLHSSSSEKVLGLR